MPESIQLPAAPAASDLSQLSSGLKSFEFSQAVRFFGLTDFQSVLKTTISLCPECLAHVPAAVFTRAGRVLMRKCCNAHGFSEALVENDAAFYQLSSKDRWGRRYVEGPVTEWPAYPDSDVASGDGFSDGITDQWSNKSCTVLAEVTNACNLACPVCYSDARGDRLVPLVEFKEQIRRLIDRKGPLDSVQLTGGEATIHPQFWEMLAYLHEQPVKKIYLPTNGIVLADPVVAQRLLPFRDKLMVLLQFDGQQAATNRAMRNVEPTRVRDAVIDSLSRLAIHMQLTMTITLGVNDHEIGWVVSTGMRHPHIKVVALQPVTYSGRYELPAHPSDRMTLSDCVKAVATQVHRHTRSGDFKPIPCSHPNCGWITLFVQRFGLTANLARHIDLEQANRHAANRTLLNSGELRSLVGGPGGLVSRLGHWAGRKLIRSTDVFAVAIKPFMDRFNYDQDRISACCHHLLDTHGTPVSFCEYNARIRMNDSWQDRPVYRTNHGGNP